MGSSRKGNAPDGSEGTVLTFFEDENDDPRLAERERRGYEPVTSEEFKRTNQSPE